jgi:hypothetical protein
MKHLYSAAIISSLLCLPAAAGILKSGSKVFQKAQTYRDSGIGFELVNKSSRPIWIGLKTGLDITQVPEKINPGKSVQYKNDISYDTRLFVWFKDPGVSEKKKEKNWFENALERVTAGAAATFTYDRSYSFPKAKTIYLTWDKDDFARPETGVLKGILKKTDTGLSLQNNVTTSDIVAK